MAEKKNKAVRIILLTALILFLGGIGYTSFDALCAQTAGTGFPVKLYAMLILFLLLLILVTGLFAFVMKKRPDYAALVTVLVFFLGMCYSAVLPPFSSPDEEGHYLAAYALSSEILGQQAYDEDGNVLMREEDLSGEDVEGSFVKLSENVTVQDYVFVRTNLLKTASGKAEYSSTYEGLRYDTTKISRLPQALGIALGRLMHRSYTFCLYLGRTFGLLLYCAFLYPALKKIPRGKSILAVTALLPMSLQMAASYNYDCLINASALLFFSCVIRLADQKTEISNRQFAGLLVLLALMTPWKLTLPLLALLCFLIPSEKFGTKKRYFACVAIAVIVVIAVTVITNHRQLYLVLTGGGTELHHTEGNSYTLSHVLTHPGETLYIFLNTFRLQGDWYLDTLIGQYPGQLDSYLAFYASTLAGFAVMLLWSAMPEEEEGTVLKSTSQAAVCVAAAVIMVLASILALDVGWTKDTADMVEGVQGRYFLCILPAVLAGIGYFLPKRKAGGNYAMLFFLMILHMQALTRIVERVPLRP